MNNDERLDVAILSAADTLLSICAVQTGTDPSPLLATDRALRALADVNGQAFAEEIRRRAAER